MSSSVGGQARRHSEAQPGATTGVGHGAPFTSRLSSYLRVSDEEDEAGPEALPLGMALAVPTVDSPPALPQRSGGVSSAAGELKDAAVGKLTDPRHPDYRDDRWW